MILREKREPSAIVPPEVLVDARLGLAALGFYAILVAADRSEDGPMPSIEIILRRDREAALTAWRELQEAGYVRGEIVNLVNEEIFAVAS